MMLRNAFLGLAATLLCGVARAETRHVAIKGMVFVPAVLELKAGDTVVWTNEDLVPHTVTGPGLDSGAIAPGKSWQTKVTAKGKTAYKCLYHPTMAATLEAK